MNHARRLIPATLALAASGLVLGATVAPAQAAAPDVATGNLIGDISVVEGPLVQGPLIDGGILNPFFGNYQDNRTS